MSWNPKPVDISQPEVVIFHNRRKLPAQKEVHKKDDQETKPNKRKADDNDDKNEENTMSLKQAKFDVFKFGIKGLSKQDQETANMQLAIKLGAKPLKNKCLNYKELMQRKKEEKEKKTQLLKENKLFELKVEQARSSAFGTNKPKIGHLNKKSRINKGEVGRIKGHIGTYSNGMLKLSKYDLKKMNILGKKK